jgi:hypothetical protein
MEVNGIMQPLAVALIERDPDGITENDTCGVRGVREDGSLYGWVNYDDETGEIGTGYTTSHTFHGWMATRAAAEAYVAGYERACNSIIRTIGRAGGEDK